MSTAPFGMSEGPTAHDGGLPETQGVISGDLVRQSGPRLDAGISGGGETGPGTLDQPGAGNSERQSRPAEYSQNASGFWRHWQDRSGRAQMTQLTNWTARVVADVQHDDGAETRRVFQIEMRQGARTAQVEVRPEDMARVRTWSLQGLGATAWITVGTQIQERVLHAVQLGSQNPRQRKVYGHTGWRTIDDVPVYLHAGGGIGAAGPVAGLEVSLPDSLGPHELPEPPAGESERAAVAAALRLLDVAPDAVTAAVFGAAWRAPLGRCEVTVFVTGPSGAGKTELSALAQQHFGPRFSARSLPAAWSGTGNSLTEICYIAKDTLVTIDDFVPKGNLAARLGLHATAEMVIRAQANATGRSRMTAEINLRGSRPPRGTLLATGEDVPSGQSLKARMLVVDLGPTDLDFARLTAAQADGRAGLFATAMAGYLRWLAAHPERRQDVRARVDALRDDLAMSTAHRRTPTLVADVALGWRTFLDYAVGCGALTDQDGEATWVRLLAGLSQAARQQDQQHAEADPADRFVEVISAALSSGRLHLSDLGGGPPEQAQAWGWVVESTFPNARSQGRRLGFVDGDNVFILPDVAMEAVSFSNSTGEEIALGKGALGKRLHERGYLLAEEYGTRGTLTVRKQAEGRRHKTWKIPTRHFGLEPPSVAAQKPSAGTSAG